MEWNVLFFFNSVLLGAGLAMDAFSVSLANGLNEPGMKTGRMCWVAGVYAVFQAVMPMIGWGCVHTILQYFRAFEKCIPWIALILLLYIGGKMLIEGLKHETDVEEEFRLGLGALMIQGITPGPLLFSTQTVKVYTIIISLFVANVMMCLLGYGAIRGFAKISMIPMKWLNPIVFMFCAVGTFAINNNIYDVFLMIGAGIVGYVLIKLDFCMPPIILGLILSGTVEENLRRTLVISDGDLSIFLEHPIAMVLLVIAVISLLSPIIMNAVKKRSAKKQAQ